MTFEKKHHCSHLEREREKEREFFTGSEQLEKGSKGIALILIKLNLFPNNCYIFLNLKKKSQKSASFSGSCDLFGFILWLLPFWSKCFTAGDFTGGKISSGSIHGKFVSKDKLQRFRIHAKNRRT